MTIKQQGGIFGRNPTFENVEIEGDLTVEGSTTKNGDEVINGRLDISGTNPFLYIMETDQADDNTYIRQAGGNFQIGQASDDKGTRKTRLWIDQSSGDIKFYNVAGDAAQLTYDSSTGNLQMADGAGIDFSATSGTGTSELFDDYEEGTWTPVWQASTTNPTLTYTNQLGYYTKIGNVVYLSCFLRTDAVSDVGSGNARIGGLPYTCANDSGKRGSVSIGNITNIGGNLAAGYAQANGTYLNMTAALGGSSNWNISNLAGNQLLQFSAVYMTA